MTDHERLRNRLTRRDALKLAGAAGATAGLGRWAPARARQATPTGERPTLRVAVQQLPDEIDPQVDSRNIRAQVLYSIFDGLIERDYAAGDPPGTGYDLSPMLATTWTRPDDLTLEVTLRAGIIAHDGQPLTAGDVKFTFDHILQEPPPEYTRAAAMFRAVERVEAIDASTVRITTSAPDPVLERRLTAWAGLIVSKSAYDQVGMAEFGRAPVGSGPYRVAEFRPGEQLILEAHDAYWGGTPPVARIEYRAFPEVASRVTALIGGEVDIATNIPPDQISAVEDAEGVGALSVPTSNLRILHYNTTHAVLADKRLRQALNLAIDRQLLVDSLWSGRTHVPRGYQYESWGDLYNAERPPLGHDPERARQLVAAAGYGGEPITLRTPANYYTLGEDVSQAVVEMWREVGVNAEAELIDIANFYENTETMMAQASSFNDEFNDPESIWLTWNAASAVGKHWWTDQRFERLGFDAGRTLDTAARSAAYQEMLDVWDDEAPGTVLYVTTETYGVRDDIDWLPYAYYFMDFRSDNLRVTAR